MVKKMGEREDFEKWNSLPLAEKPGGGKKINLLKNDVFVHMQDSPKTKLKLWGKGK